MDQSTLQTIGIFLSPSLLLIIALIINKRIDDLREDIKGFRLEINYNIKDLRSEMKMEHAALANKVDSLSQDFTKHLIELHGKQGS